MRQGLERKQCAHRNTGVDDDALDTRRGIRGYREAGPSRDRSRYAASWRALKGVLQTGKAP